MKKWKIDPNHSEIKFKVKHLVVSTVSGRFNNFEAEIESNNNDFENAKAMFEADVNSINTNNEMRDAHLRSADFFDAENNPKMTFISRSFRKRSGEKYELKGDMTIRGITKEVTLDVIYNGSATGLDGSELAAFEVYGKLNRFEFGLHWNSLTEAGGLTVGAEIRLEIFAEMKQAAEVGKAA